MDQQSHSGYPGLSSCGLVAQPTSMKKKSQPASALATKPIQRGKWVYKPLVSVVIVCACGNKYVSTRKDQSTCIRCMQKNSMVR